MGAREDLISGARACLLDKGYARTTARDIASAAGVSLAAIGYHFGGKEALLRVALQQTLADWGDDLARVVPEGADFTGAWTRVIESFERTRQLWAVQFELIANLEREEELRSGYAEANRDARLELAALFHGADLAPERSERIGALYQVLLAGLAAVYLADPEATPSARELLEAMKDVAG